MSISFLKTSTVLLFNSCILISDMSISPFWIVIIKKQLGGSGFLSDQRRLHDFRFLRVLDGSAPPVARMPILLISLWL
nr:MAG TPA: hypothetical protein [Bacteriophage sp.]